MIASHIFVAIAWLIPGKSHQWAKRVMAERKAMLKYTKHGNEKWLKD